MHFNFLLTLFPLINTELAWTLCFWSGFYPIKLTYVGCLFDSVGVVFYGMVYIHAQLLSLSIIVKLKIIIAFAHN